MKKKVIKDQVLIYHDEYNSVTLHPVLDESANMVTTDAGVLPLSAAKSFVNSTNNSILHVYKLDIPAKTEAENLVQLRKSVALRNMFKFERSTGEFDIMKWMPWIMAIAILLFK